MDHAKACSFIGDRWFVNRIHLSGLRVEALEISFIGDRWAIQFGRVAVIGPFK